MVVPDHQHGRDPSRTGRGRGGRPGGGHVDHPAAALRQPERRWSRRHLGGGGHPRCGQLLHGGPTMITLANNTREPAAARTDEGSTLIEVLVAISLFTVLGALLLGFAISTGKVTDDTRSMTRVSEETRLAMERLTRELRQRTDERREG